MSKILPELPVYAKTLGIQYAEAQPNHPSAPPILMLAFGKKLSGRPGFLHGGVISALLENAATTALHHTLMQRGTDYNIQQANVTIDFIRGGMDHITFGQGEITRVGRSMANISASLWQDDPDRIIAKAHMHYLISDENEAG